MVRVSNRTPICSSSRRMAWLKPDVEMFNCFAARVKLRSSATARNADSSRRHHCRQGGWIRGNTIDGTQADYVRIPYADTTLYAIPADGDAEALVMLSDILPTGFECGVLNGQVRPGDIVAIVGAGPVGLAALLTAQFYSPASIVMVDLDDQAIGGRPDPWRHGADQQH